MKREHDFGGGKRGAVIPQPGKTRITIYIDDDILEAFRDRADSAGRGYQTMINEALRDHWGKARQPIDEETLRRVLREELPRCDKKPSVSVSRRLTRQKRTAAE
jgi:hypothetical protein